MASKNNTDDDSESFKSLSERIKDSEVKDRRIINKERSSITKIYEELKSLNPIPDSIGMIKVKPLKQIKTENKKFSKIYLTCDKDEKFLFLFFQTEGEWNWNVFKVPEITDDEIKKILAENTANPNTQKISETIGKPTNENVTKDDFGTNTAVGVNPDTTPTLPIAYVNDTDIGDLSLDNNYPFYFKKNSNDGEYNNSPIEIQYRDTQESSYEPTPFSTSFGNKVSELFSRGFPPNTKGYYEMILREGGAPDILIRLFKSVVSNNQAFSFTYFLNNELENPFLAKDIRSVMKDFVKEITGIEFDDITTNNGTFKITSTETVYQNLRPIERVFLQYLVASLAIKFDQEIERIDVRRTLLQLEEMSLNEQTQTMIGETLLIYEARETIISLVMKKNIRTTTPLQTNLLEGRGFWDKSIEDITDNNPDDVNLLSFNQLASGQGVLSNVIENRHTCNSIQNDEQRIKCQKYVYEQIKHVHEILKGIRDIGKVSEENLKLFLFIFGPNTCTTIRDGFGDIPYLLKTLKDFKILGKPQGANEPPTLSVDNNGNQITRDENINRVRIILTIEGQQKARNLFEINDSQLKFLQTSLPNGEVTQQVTQISLKDLEDLHNKVSHPEQLHEYIGKSLEYKKKLFYEENEDQIETCIALSEKYLNEVSLTQDNTSELLRKLSDLKTVLEAYRVKLYNDILSQSEEWFPTITNMIQNPIYVVTGGIAFIGFAELCKYFIQEKVKKMTPCEKVATKLQYMINKSK